MQFEYPWQNDKKKMKFVIKGLQLARYLVTVLGSNIKTVTWMGDNINYNTVFQGGSRAYLSEDVNETEGTYDVMNSAVTIIDKLGPLNEDAPYVVEFKKEPQNTDWANFMISCQGIGDDVQMSSLEGYATVVPGTAADQSDANLYTSTTSMEPELDDDTFIPSLTELPGPVTVYSNGASSTVSRVGTNTAYFYRGSGNTASASLYTNNLKAGYYLVTITAIGSSTMTMSYSLTWTGSVIGVNDRKSLHSTYIDIDNSSSNFQKLNTTQLAIHVTSDISSESRIAAYEYTSGANSRCDYASATLSAITQSQYEAL